VEDDGGEQGFDVWDLISKSCSPVMVQKDVAAFLTHVRALLPLPLSSKGRKQLATLLMITACCLTCRSASHDFAKQSVLHMFKDLTMLLDQRQRAACWAAVFRRFCWPSHDIDARASSAHVEVLSAVAGVFLEEEEDEASLRQMWLLLYDAYSADRAFVMNWCRLLQLATRTSLTLTGRPCYKRPTSWHSKILVVHLPHSLHLLLHFYRSTLLTMYHCCSLLFHRLQ